jgi:toxin YoeB
MKVRFDEPAIDAYNEFAQTDKKLFSKIVVRMRDIQRTSFSGFGKPEPLKYALSECWSRRINDEHRLVYKVENDTLYIKSCRNIMTIDEDTIETDLKEAAKNGGASNLS